MAISFALNLTPNQIEFLQALDLYADGAASIGAAFDLSPMSIMWVKKMIREGLVEHVKPGPTQCYEGGPINCEVIRAYRITDKGRQVLTLIESDVQAFLQRQKAYQQTKKNGRKRA